MFILEWPFAKVIAVFRISSVIDGQNSLISNWINAQFCLLVMFSNHSLTLLVFFHWLYFNCFTRVSLTHSSFDLLIFPSSFFEGFIKWHVGLSSIVGYCYQILLSSIVKLSTTKHCRKSLLFSDNQAWKRKSTDSCFNVTIKNYDSAEIC